jgi:hypothetical protein
VGKILDQALGRSHRVLACARLLRGDLLEDLAQRLLPPATPLHRTRQIVWRKSVERRDREVVDVPRIRWQRNRGKERDKQANLGALIELTAA